MAHSSDRSAVGRTASAQGTDRSANPGRAVPATAEASSTRGMVSQLAASRLLVSPRGHRTDEQTLAHARAAYEAKRFASALALYEPLGAGGNATAAEIAGRMLLFGAALYGRRVRQDKPRAAVLLALASRAGSATARHLLNALEADRSAPNPESFEGDQP